MQDNCFSYFIFEFYDDKSYGYLASFKIMLEDSDEFFRRLDFFFENLYERYTCTFDEEYGLHQTSFSLPFIYGFFSDEVKYHDISLLMTQWQRCFERNNFQTGPIEILALDEETTLKEGEEQLIVTMSMESRRLADRLS